MLESGWGPWRRVFFSFCSFHRQWDPACHMCAAGTWRNHWRWRASAFIFKRWPRLWVWWVNRGRDDD